MERNFYDDEFEDFLKQRSDQYTLYPSTKVWSRVHDFLHIKRNWHTIAGTFFLLTVLVFISLEIDSSHKNLPKEKKTSSTDSRLIAATKITQLQSTPIAPAGAVAVSFTSFKEMPAAVSPLSMNLEPIELIDSYELPTPGHLPGHIVSADSALSETISLPDQATKKTTGTNWLQDIAIQTQLLKKDNRLKVQFYFSPTASYRKLKNNKDAINSKMMDATPLSGSPMEVDGLVDHEPSVGLEIGSSLRFNISKRVTLKAGTQLNYVRYTINAFRSYPEKAQITLSSVVNSSYSETITSYSSIRNTGTRDPDNFQNRYVEVSLPVGADYKVLGNKRWQFNVGGSVQPTYILHNETYVLSGNYNNYTKDPGLVRRWNINGAVESSISYKTGDLQFQAGPQFRYQLLSTYTDRYKIRENLMEYGIKIGVIKSIK